MKMFFISLIVCLIACLSNQNIEIVQRISAHQIENGYNILSTDSVFSWRNKRYLVDAIEDYNNGKLVKVSVWKSLGYLEFSEKKVLDSKKFQQSYGLADSLVLTGLTKDEILMNGKYYTLKGKYKAKIYLGDKSDRHKLYVIRLKVR